MAKGEKVRLLLSDSSDSSESTTPRSTYVTRNTANRTNRQPRGRNDVKITVPDSSDSSGSTTPRSTRIAPKTNDRTSQQIRARRNDVKIPLPDNSDSSGSATPRSTRIAPKTKNRTNTQRKGHRKPVSSLFAGWFYDFFCAEPERCRIWKLFLGFPLGGLLGWALFLLVVSPMELEETTKNQMGVLTVLGFAGAFASSVRFRSMCLLLIPIFMGKAGRAYIGTFAITSLMAGPIENLINNTKDVTRSLSCAAELSANQSAAKWKFRLAPVGNVLKDMKDEGFMLNKMGNKINKAFVPMKKQIRGEEGVAAAEADTVEEDIVSKNKIDRSEKVNTETNPLATHEEAERVEQKYRKKIQYKCEEIYNKGIAKCRDVFRNLESNCRRKVKVPVIKEVCIVFRLDFVCNIIRLLGKALGGECDTKEAVHSEFGQLYKASENSISSMEEGFVVNVKYKIVKEQEPIDFTSVEEMGRNTMREFDRGKAKLKFVFVILKRFLGFTFLFVIIGAYKYQRKYVSDLRFDNVYISRYFRKIDARRKKQGKRVLLPLKKIEARAYISTSNPGLLKGERQKVVKGVIIVIARAFMAGMVFFMAYVLRNVMDIIRRHSRVDYHQQGTNHIDVTVAGTGFMSQIVRLFMNGLNTKNTLHHVSSNLQCLPKPMPLDNEFYVDVFGIYIILLVLVILDGYALRLRRVIAGVFFRKREKQRILYLYNTLLKKRKYFLRSMRRKMKRKAKKFKLSSKRGLLQSLRHQFPALCGWLSVIGSAKNRCLVCEEAERKAFFRCDNPACQFIYCPECWADIKRKCYACLPLDQFSSTDSGDSAESGSDDGF